MNRRDTNNKFQNEVNDTKADRGFGLLQMIAGIAIIGMITLVGLPGMVSKLVTCDLENNAQEIATALMVARLKAIETKMPHRVKFDLSENPQKYIVQRGVTTRGVTTWVDNVVLKEIKGDVTITKFDSANGVKKENCIGSIEFSAKGVPTNGSIQLEDKEGGHYMISLNVVTGRVSTGRAI